MLLVFIPGVNGQVISQPEVFSPGRTLADDLENFTLGVDENYLRQSPRLLFGATDKLRLQQKAKAHPELWARVIRNAKSVRSESSVPNEEFISKGQKYWRVERLQSASLAWFVTGDPVYRDGVIRWMLAYSKVPVWGTDYRPNLDLVASWYLYHLSIAYDTLRSEMTDEDRAVIREGLVLHARAIYEDRDPSHTEHKIRYDQNHTYIPMVALTAASLVLWDEVPEARSWFARSTAVLRRCRYVLSEDGYYYEGFGYWTYAIHWHVRVADLMRRATGENWMELPALHDTWKMALYLSLPDFPGAFDVGDTLSWKVENVRPAVGVSNHPMLWGVAAATASGESQAAGNMYDHMKVEQDYPAMAFLWFDPEVEKVPFYEINPYHYFPDHGVVSWKSGWGKEDTSVLFRCGPPLGHRATEKLKEFDDWIMNCGHVHPDIGAFWLYAKGAYLAVDTGYLAEKWTRDHNTLLVDGKGQGADGSYWNERGIPYEIFDRAKIEAQYLCPEYGFVRGEFGSVYQPQVPGVTVQRSLLMTKEWVLVVDDLSAESAHTFTWLCHADAEFVQAGDVHLSKLADASLAVFSLGSDALKSQLGPAVVVGGTSPGRGVPQQRGFQLQQSTETPTTSIRMIHLLVPLSPGQALPVIGCQVDEKGILHLKVTGEGVGDQEVRLDLNWASAPSEPPEKKNAPVKFN